MLGRQSTHDRVSQATRGNRDGQEEVSPPESGIPEFHYQEPREEGEELYRQAVLKWLPLLMYTCPDEGLFGKDS
eukprot:13114197-Alexandrium_andersonii.AAC.1